MAIVSAHPLGRVHHIAHVEGVSTAHKQHAGRRNDPTIRVESHDHDFIPLVHVCLAMYTINLIEQTSGKTSNCCEHMGPS
jgi:hypothetical protein